MTRAYEMEHLVTFEETNLVGNVYYVNHVRWQGACRERFLEAHCPGVLADLRGGLALATTRCSCAYFAELEAFDRITVRMTLGGVSQNRVLMRFDYLRDELLVARGEQEVACMRRDGDALRPVPVPAEMLDALAGYAANAAANP
ncbi:MAG TPA: acyl-CoA thioesterase [Solirubrobacteraceae bacterium]|jgi:enediyne biosynthesis thioesterase|nr:acyl-CoA thioesterase [Solirubrobacteraceae bacterium]